MREPRGRPYASLYPDFVIIIEAELDFSQRSEENYRKKHRLRILYCLVSDRAAVAEEAAATTEDS